MEEGVRGVGIFVEGSLSKRKEISISLQSKDEERWRLRPTKDGGPSYNGALRRDNLADYRSRCPGFGHDYSACEPGDTVYPVISEGSGRDRIQGRARCLPSCQTRDFD